MKAAWKVCSKSAAMLPENVHCDLSSGMCIDQKRVAIVLHLFEGVVTLECNQLCRSLRAWRRVVMSPACGRLTSTATWENTKM